MMIVLMGLVIGALGGCLASAVLSGRDLGILGIIFAGGTGGVLTAQLLEYLPIGALDVSGADTVWLGKLAIVCLGGGLMFAFISTLEYLMDD